MSNYPPGVSGNHPHIAGYPIDIADLTDEEIADLLPGERASAIDSSWNPERELRC